MCVCEAYRHYSTTTKYLHCVEAIFYEEKKIIIISGRSNRSPNHPTPPQSICSSSSFVSACRWVSAVDVDWPSEGTAETIGSMLQHVTSRIPRLSLRPSGFRRLFLLRIFKNTQLAQIPLDPRAFLRRSGFACSAYQKIVSLMSIYIW